MSDENEKSTEASVGFEPAQAVMDTIQAFFDTHPDYDDEMNVEFGEVSIGECPDCGGDTGRRSMLMQFEGTTYVILCQPLPEHPGEALDLEDAPTEDDEGGLADELDPPHVH